MVQQDTSLQDLIISTFAASDTTPQTVKPVSLCARRDASSANTNFDSVIVDWGGGIPNPLNVARAQTASTETNLASSGGAALRVACEWSGGGAQQPAQVRPPRARQHSCQRDGRKDQRQHPVESDRAATHQAGVRVS